MLIADISGLRLFIQNYSKYHLTSPNKNREIRENLFLQNILKIKYLQNFAQKLAVRPNKIDEEIIGQFSKTPCGMRGLDFIYYENGS